MGANNSRYNSEEPEKNPGEISVGEIVLGSDPRSPTPDISRTPLQTQDGVQSHKITKNVDLTKECFEKFNKNIPMNPDIRSILNEIDPRSPTVDFQRTPLAVLIKNPELMATYNKINVSLDCSNASEIDIEESKVPTLCPKNLETELKNLSIAQNEGETLSICVEEPMINLNLDKVPVLGLLETNLDYLETDLDTVRRRPKNKLIQSVKDKSEDDPRSPSIGIDRTPILIPNVEQVQDKVQTPETKTEIKDIFNAMSLQRKRDNKIRSNTESLLIYEDVETEKTVAPPTVKVPNVQSNERVRTPLACMMNIEQNPKSGEIKSEKNSAKQGKSKIPVKVKCTPRFLAMHNAHTPRKGVKSSTKKIRKVTMEVNENTPPKPRQARWDQDVSVIL